MDATSLTQNTSFSTYAINSKNVYIFTTVAMVIIIIFMITPLNNFFITSIIAQIIVIIILAFALYQNYQNANFLSNATNTSFYNGEWNSIKTNIISSYIFSIFIIVLIFSVIKNMIV
jgi:hypothetical protein